MTFQENKWYFIEFLDHSMGSKALDSIKCQIIGKFCKEDKVQYSFIVWENTHPEYQEDNREFVNVVKGTILRKKQIPI